MVQTKRGKLVPVQTVHHVILEHFNVITVLAWMVILFVTISRIARTVATNHLDDAVTIIHQDLHFQVVTVAVAISFVATMDNASIVRKCAMEVLAAVIVPMKLLLLAALSCKYIIIVIIVDNIINCSKSIIIWESKDSSQTVEKAK